jgi:hypothetical protein
MTNIACKRGTVPLLDVVLDFARVDVAVVIERRRDGWIDALSFMG